MFKKLFKKILVEEYAYQVSISCYLKRMRKLNSAVA